MDLDALAEEMQAAQDACRQIEPLTARVDGFDVGAAYAVALRVHAARVRAGRVPVGRKIGFTNSNIWAEYGVYAPIWGFMYDSTVMRWEGPSATCRIGALAEPRIEPEIVLHFRAAPPQTDDPAALLASIDWIAHGFEIVQSHYAGWKFRAADTIADGALHGRLVVGAPRRVDEAGADIGARLERFTLTLSCDGEVREHGVGANVLGGPLAAVAHLIGVLAQQPDAPPLRAGELVTTGTLTRALPIRAGETWSTKLEGIDLAGLSVTFAA